jgi:hypothetical protein
MRFTLSTLLATLLTTAPLLAAAQDCASVVCALGDWACRRTCELEGHPEGGKCVQRDGCPAGDQICVCGAKKRDVIDGDELLKKALEAAGTSVDAFVDGVFEPDDRDFVKRGEEVDKRSICCSLPGPAAGFCCEIHCSQIGHPEGGQCNKDGVCACG